MTEWADDPGTRGDIEIRCVQPSDGYPNGIMSCGWRGTVRAVTQYGATTWEIIECPQCGGPVEII